MAMNNTYFFYRGGFRGVLVEPNVEMCKKLRAVRPQDTTLEAGIGVTAAREADYYLMTESAWNTFSKEEAEHMTRVTRGGIKVERVVKMPLLEINDVMAKHFDGPPTLLSIDAEGLHLAILKTIDFNRFRPAVIFVETLVAGTKRQFPEIPAFIETTGNNVARGSAFVQYALRRRQPDSIRWKIGPIARLKIRPRPHLPARAAAVHQQVSRSGSPAFRQWREFCVTCSAFELASWPGADEQRISRPTRTKGPSSTDCAAKGIW